MRAMHANPANLHLFTHYVKFYIWDSNKKGHRAEERLVLNASVELYSFLCLL